MFDRNQNIVLTKNVGQTSSNMLATCFNIDEQKMLYNNVRTCPGLKHGYFLLVTRVFPTMQRDCLTEIGFLLGIACFWWKKASYVAGCRIKLCSLTGKSELHCKSMTTTDESSNNRNTVITATEIKLTRHITFTA